MTLQNLTAVAALAVFVAGPVFSSNDIEWVDLIDQSKQEYEDPFLDLDNEQIYDLATVVRLRNRLAEDDVDPEAKLRIEERLQDSEESLAEQDIDVDWLISQRWIVADRREAAATAANPALDGTTVSMFGFTIPVQAEEDGVAELYLVPERGMCSHMPPPPPNQMLRVFFDPDLFSPSSIYEPVKVTGTLRIAESNRSVTVVDGPVPMQVVFELDATEVEPYYATQYTDSVQILDSLGATDLPQSTVETEN